MRFFARILILASLCFISLLWLSHHFWRDTLQSEVIHALVTSRLDYCNIHEDGSEAAAAAESSSETTDWNGWPDAYHTSLKRAVLAAISLPNSIQDYWIIEPTPEEGQPLTFDTLLRAQQLKKKRLRSFCKKTGKITKLPSAQQEASQVLSSMMVNNKLNFLYCKIPAVGVETWEQLLEILTNKENVTLQMPISSDQQFGSQRALMEYNVSSVEAMLKSYTKVIFVREPFQRLIAAYMYGLADGLTFKEFVEYILYSGTSNASMEWMPLVNLCRPCLIQYDYVMTFGFLDDEVRHLMLRTGLPENIQIPEFIDSKVRWTYKWLEEQMLSELPQVQRKRLCHFFRFDFTAFHFPKSLLWDFICKEDKS